MKEFQIKAPNNKIIKEEIQKHLFSMGRFWRIAGEMISHPSGEDDVNYYMCGQDGHISYGPKPHPTMPVVSIERLFEMKKCTDLKGAFDELPESDRYKQIFGLLIDKIEKMENE